MFIDFNLKFYHFKQNKFRITFDKQTKTKVAVLTLMDFINLVRLYFLKKNIFFNTALV